MKKLLVVLATLLACNVASAADNASIKASGAWIRVLPGSLPAGGYVTFENTGSTGTAITGASSADYAESMIHKSSTETGMGRMEMVDKVALPANGKVMFSPGGYHVMLMQPKHAITAGDKVVVTFTLSDGTTLPVTFTAKPANATGP